MPQLIVKLGVDQMDLAQIGLGGIARRPRAMLDGHSLMRVALDAQPGHEANAGLVSFDQSVPRAAADSSNGAIHVRNALLGRRRQWLRKDAVVKLRALPLR